MFARRVWLLSKGNIWLTGLICFFAVPAFGFAISNVVILIDLPDPTVLITGGGKWVAVRRSIEASFAVTLMAEISVTGTMFYCLWTSKTGFKRTDSHIRSLLFYTINTASLVIVTTTLSLALLYSIPNTTYTATFYFITSKLYVNSYLALLNARESLLARGITSVQMTPSQVDSTRGTGSAYEMTKNKIVMLQSVDKYSDGETTKGHGHSLT
jgi:hypothetical protein